MHFPPQALDGQMTGKSQTAMLSPHRGILTSRKKQAFVRPFSVENSALEASGKISH